MILSVVLPKETVDRNVATIKRQISFQIAFTYSGSLDDEVLIIRDPPQYCHTLKTRYIHANMSAVVRRFRVDASNWTDVIHPQRAHCENLPE